MKLSKIAILALKGLGQDVKDRIGKAVGVHPHTVYKWMSDNEENSDLTKASVVQIISEETGLTQEQILDEVEESKIAS